MGQRTQKGSAASGMRNAPRLIAPEVYPPWEGAQVRYAPDLRLIQSGKQCRMQKRECGNRRYSGKLNSDYINVTGLEITE